MSPRYQTQIARGPKVLFSEKIEYNLSTLSRWLPDPNLVYEEFIIGRRSRRKVVMAYLKDLANPGIVSEIKDRLGKIESDFILENSFIERNIQNSSWSPFPQIEKTFRPDVTESALAQGRVAIFVDGSPNALTVPVTFFELMDIPVDAYRRWPIFSSFFRLTRYLLLLIATFLPSFYISLTSFNPEVIPTNLAFLIAGAREGNPFPVYIEAFTLMGVAEAIRIVLLRFPNPIGQTIALFSGLTFVGTGLYANLISAPAVAVVTLTVLASFSIPDFDLRSSIRMLQLFTMLMASIFGFFGVAVSFFYITIHLVCLKSFGIPFLAPLAPLSLQSWGHTIIRENTREMPLDQTYQPLKKHEHKKKGGE